MRTAIPPRAALIVIGVLVSGLLAACGSSTPISPDQSNVPFSITELTVGTGDEAVVGKTASVNYNLWLYDESGVDKKGSQIGPGSFSFILGLGQVIPGFEQGITGMRVGGTRRVIVPPSLAYGGLGSGTTIPPNAALVFEVALVAVQ
jgi:FKBP-type peptidyl-prolyl cis-trans isomerase FkpA